MSTMNIPWRTLTVASLTAAALAGCGGSDNTVSPTPPPAPQTVAFSEFVNQTFSNSANSTPVPVANVDFTFDVNDDPTAFDALIASGSFGAMGS